MKCTNCGSARFPMKRETWQYKECGLSNVKLIGVPVYRCGECGEIEVVIPRLPELHQLLAEELARKRTPLVAEEFRFLRKHLGFSSTDFAKKIGVALETVSRWESGKLKHPIDPIAEVLLRLLVATSKPIDHYPDDVFPVLPTEGKARPKPARVAVTAPRKASGAWQEAVA